MKKYMGYENGRVLNPAILFPNAGNVLVVVASAALPDLTAGGQVSLRRNNEPKAQLLSRKLRSRSERDG
ncbi:MAG TPA: hypothetical protein VN664_10960 [Burkholderiales bacterium]|nr:hypothetical protein [Burkholderiales bacterium]